MQLPTLATMRDGIKQLSPGFLREGNAEKFLYTIGLALDCLLEKQDQASKAHLPGLGTDTALPYLGDDRVIVQGPAESNAAYALRLQGALDAWGMAGSRRAVLGQVQAFLTNTQPGVLATMPEVLIVGGNGTYATWDSLTFGDAQGAPPTHILQSPSNWEWDGQESAKPHRAWLVLFFSLVATGHTGTTGATAATSGGFVTFTGPGTLTAARGHWITISGGATPATNGTFPIVSTAPGSVVYANPGGVVDANSGALSWSIGEYPFIGPALAWGDPGTTWGDPTRSWGLSCRTQLMASVRSLVQTWKESSTYFPWIVCAFDGGGGAPGDWFSPYSAAGAGNPDGTWGPWAKNVGGVMVPSRVTASGRDAFADGTGQYNQCSVHNVT